MFYGRAAGHDALFSLGLENTMKLTGADCYDLGTREGRFWGPRTHRW